MDICSEMEEDKGKDEPKSQLVPQFFPVFDPSQFDLSHLDMAVVLDICKALPHIEQASFLLASKEVSQHLEANVLLFQLRRAEKIMHRVLGQWSFWMRWEKPREIAKTVRDRDERLRFALRDFITLMTGLGLLK